MDGRKDWLLQARYAVEDGWSHEFALGWGYTSPKANQPSKLNKRAKVANLRSGRLRVLHPWLGSMILVDAIWLATEPMDMRAGSRAGEHARDFLGTWNCKLVCDDFVVYKASFVLAISEIGYMEHARRT